VSGRKGTSTMPTYGPPDFDISAIEPLVDAEAIATILGCTAATVREWHHTQSLPAVRIGTRLMFLVSDVVAWRKDRQTVVVKREEIQIPAPGRPRRRMSRAEAKALDEEFPY